LQSWHSSPAWEWPPRATTAIARRARFDTIRFMSSSRFCALKTLKRYSATLYTLVLPRLYDGRHRTSFSAAPEDRNRRRHIKKWPHCCPPILPSCASGPLGKAKRLSIEGQCRDHGTVGGQTVAMQSISTSNGPCQAETQMKLRAGGSDGK